MPWQCFVAEPTGRYYRALRRYSHAHDVACSQAPGRVSYHNAETRIEDAPEGDPDRVVNEAVSDELKRDPRWPAACVCGYAFEDADEWQLFTERLYRNPATGEEFTLRNAPVGAIVYAPWLALRHIDPKEMVKSGWLSASYIRGWHGKRDPILIQCPGRVAQWCPDAIANNGPGWEVTGELPNITARPSIGMPQYHGWLTDGVLSDDLEGRTY